VADEVLDGDEGEVVSVAEASQGVEPGDGAAAIAPLRMAPAMVSEHLVFGGIVERLVRRSAIALGRAERDARKGSHPRPDDMRGESAADGVLDFVHVSLEGEEQRTMEIVAGPRSGP
jgi:hypothetical protein